MRLIDADALKEEIEFHPTSVSVCMTVEQARGETNFKLRCLEDIDNAPTIDAIPMEWLREKMQKPQTTCANPFGFVLAEWLEEHPEPVYPAWRDWLRSQYPMMGPYTMTDILEAPIPADIAQKLGIEPKEGT